MGRSVCETHEHNGYPERSSGARKASGKQEGRPCRSDCHFAAEEDKMAVDPLSGLPRPESLIVGLKKQGAQDWRF